MAGMYNWRWQKAREQFLIQHPLCVYCLAKNKTKLAEVVDHIKPHKGNHALFWDSDNWQSLCKRCHDSDKAIEERGKMTTNTATGMPTNPNHHWNAG